MRGCGPAACIVEYGRALDISYLQYLWEAHTSILRCLRACRVWSARYDGDSPKPDASATAGRSKQPLGNSEACPAPRKDKAHTELEWDDTYDAGMSSGTPANQPEPPAPPAPVEPPKHIQELKRNALQLFRGTYIEESDFQDDVIVYRLCAQKDVQENAAPLPPGPATDNGPLSSSLQEAGLGEEDQSDPSDLSPNQAMELGPEGASGCNVELAASITEAEPQPNPEAAGPKGENLTTQHPMALGLEGKDLTAQHPTAVGPGGGDLTAQHPMALGPEGEDLTIQHPAPVGPEGEDLTAQHPMTVSPEGEVLIVQDPVALSSEGGDLTAQHPTTENPNGDLLAQYDQIIKELDSVPEGLMEVDFSSVDPLLLTAEQEQGVSSKAKEERKALEEEEDDFDSLIAEPPALDKLASPFGVRDNTASAGHQPPRTQNTPFTGDELN